MTELHEAASNGDLKTLRCVLVGADIDIDAEDWDWGKRTALHVAASKGCWRSTKLLLDHGADPQMRMVGGWTPAHCAAEGGHIDVLQMLIKHGCPMYLRDNSGDTPADIAAVYGHMTTKKLLEKAVDEQNAKKNHGLSCG